MSLCFICETNPLCLWQYLPPVESRSVSGFVGLKNGGATCYMNAVFQQLYMSVSIALIGLPAQIIPQKTH